MSGNKCIAITRRKTRCRNNAMKNSDYCYVHSFGHLKRVPFWKNPVIHLVFSIVVAIIIFLISLRCTASKQEQKKSRQEQKKMLSLLEEMQRIDETEYKKLIQKYPHGYILFAVDHKENIIPYNSHLIREQYEIEWNTAKAILSEEEMFFAFPTMYGKKRKVSFVGNTVSIPRGVVSYPSGFEIFGLGIYAELLVDNSDVVIGVIGFKEAAEKQW